MRFLALTLALVLANCGSSPDSTPKAEAKPAPVRDHTLMLPANNRTGAKVVSDHILGLAKLPEVRWATTRPAVKSFRCS